jgi:hypothetical protein
MVTVRADTFRTMPKRTSKPEPDPNQLAKSILDRATADAPAVSGHAANHGEPKKNPAAVELGRLGGLKGGKARAEKLTPKERTDIARHAARLRWEKKR